MKILGLLFYCTVAFATEQSHKYPITITSNGSFLGSIIKSQLGKDIFSYFSIRYAEAPTGKHRFKAASPAKPHNGVFNATQPGPACALPYDKGQEISDDCLRLNVYTTTPPQNQSTKPVIVFFHPGAYWQPFGSSYGLGPHYALDEEIILVTVNYRLGALGFLSTGDERAPGNAGLKDQVLALKWVQQNIEFFGGDPDKVTIAGHNIGAASVTMHIASSMSSGLFHRAMTMAGAVPIYNSLPGDYKDIAKEQARLLGCPGEISDEMFDCLGEKSAKEFADTYRQLSNYYGHPVIFLPVVESSATAQPFITDQLINVISQGKGNSVPLYSGVTKDEFMCLAMRAEEQALNGNPQLYDEFNNNWYEIAPKRFNYERGTAKSFHISAGLKTIYFKDRPLQVGSYNALGNLYSDALTFYPVYKWVKLYAQYSSQPIYNYLDNYENSDAFKKWSNGTRVGITHYDQIVFLFKIPGRPDISHEDSLQVQKVWELIANFAETGDPMPENKAGKYPVKWEPSTLDKPQYLDYNNEYLKMVGGYVHASRMEELDELMKFPSFLK